MGYLIIAIVVLVLLARLLELIAQVGLASFPAWSVGLIVGFIALHLSRKKWLRSLHLEEKLTTLVNLNFNGSRLECSINSEEIDKYPAGGPTIKAVVSSIVVFTGIFIYLTIQTKSFWGHNAFGSKISEETSIVLGLIMSTIIISAAFGLAKPNKTSECLLVKEIEKFVSIANISLTLIDSLQEIIKKNNEYADALKMQFPDTYTPSIGNYIEKNKLKILVDASGLEKHINSEIKKAKDDCVNLARVKTIFDQVMQLYFSTVTVVNKTGSQSMIYLLDQLSIGLEGLKEFLPRKEWGKFNEGISFVLAELDNLYNNACHYDPAVETERGEDQFQNPYCILRVSADATDEEIKKLYRNLCAIYHPDKRIVKDESAFKEIAAAYEQIKKLRNIR